MAAGVVATWVLAELSTKPGISVLDADISGYGRTVGLIAAAAVGVPAAVLAYYRQRALDTSNRNTADQHEHKVMSDNREHRSGVERNLRDRYTTCAEQLGHDSSAIRLAGVYALASLADDWHDFGNDSERQVCVDLLCAYLRARRKPATETPDSEASPPDAAEQNVRSAIVDSIRVRTQSVEDRWIPCTFDLRGADLTGAELGGANLTKAILTRANLTNANLPDANLVGVILTNTNLTNAKLFRANLTNAKPFRANLREAKLREAKLTDAFLGGANLYRANLYRADLTGANLAGANLPDANLTGANLTQANLGGAKLCGAKLPNADLTNADLTDTNLTKANLPYANLAGADLTDAFLGGANLYRANLTGADLTGADLTDTNLTDTNLTETNLGGANLTGADLTGADLSGVVSSESTVWTGEPVPQPTSPLEST